MDIKKLVYKCDHCEKSFFNEEILSLHLKANHKSIVKNLKKCDLCENTFTNGHYLQMHVETVHMNKIVFECDTCSMKFTF